MKLTIVLFLLSIMVTQAQESSLNYLFKFSILDAKEDSILNEKIRDAFEDDNDSISFKSISIDLNNDNLPEKIIPNEYLCGSGGCPWFVWSVGLMKIIGKIDGKTILVNKMVINGYHSLETFWSLGGGEGVVKSYEFENDSYIEVKKTFLKGDQVEVYLDSIKVN